MRRLGPAVTACVLGLALIFAPVEARRVDITVDFWQTFEFTTLDTTNLAANDNNAGGTWTITNPSSYLATSTSAEKASGGTINTTSDSGSRGLRYDGATDFVEGIVTYAFASSHADLSFGFWFRFPAEYAGSFEGGQPDILYIENVTATRELYIKLWDDGSSHIVLFTPEQGYSTNIDVEPDTWYWITGRYFTTHSLRVYDDTGAQVGSEVTRTGTSTAATQASLGNLIGDEGGNGPFDFDDWVMDWADATFPLGPPIADPATLEQEGFRWRADDGSETTATWLASQDANITRAVSLNTRLRLLVNATNDPDAAQYQLDYKLSTDGAYAALYTSQSALSSAELTAGASTANAATYETASVTLTAGRRYLIGFTHSDAASEQAASSVASTGGAVTFSSVSSVVYDTIATNVHRLEVWTAVPTATVTATITITLNDAGTGCAWILREYTDAGSLGTPATNNADASTSVSATVGALAAATSHIVAFGAHDLNATGDTASGTNWSSAGTGQAYGTPATGLEAAVNTGGSATQVTFSGAGSSDRAVIAVEVQQAAARPILIATSANITASGEATTAQLTAPSGKSTSDFVAGRLMDDENPADAVDITANDYTELEWNLTAASGVASDGQLYQFRVTASGVALDTYTVTPEWTIGSGAAVTPKILLMGIGAWLRAHCPDPVCGPRLEREERRR